MADPLSIAAGVAGLLGFTYTAAKLGYPVKNCLADASADFNQFRNEVNNFAAIWRLVTPYLERDQTVISEDLREGLLIIRNDTSTILQSFHVFIRQLIHTDTKATTQELEQRYRGAKIGQFRYKEKSANRFKLFWNREEIQRQRLQLLHAHTSVNSVLHIINLLQTQTGPAQQHLEAIKSAEQAIEERRVSLSRLQDEQSSSRDKHRAGIQAQAWLPQYPDPDSDESPVYELARVWLSPAPADACAHNVASLGGNTVALASVEEIHRGYAPQGPVFSNAQYTSSEQYAYAWTQNDIGEQQQTTSWGYHVTTHTSTPDSVKLHQKRMLNSLQQSEHDLKTTKHDLERSREEEARLRTNVRKLKRENTLLSQRQDVLESEVKREKKARQTATENMNQCQFESQQALYAMGNDIRRLRTQRDEQQEQRDRVDAIVARLESRLDATERQREADRTEMNNENQRLAGVVTDVQAQMGQLQSRVRAAEDQKRILELRVQTIEDEKQTLEARIRTLEAENEQLSTVNADLQDASEAMRRDLNDTIRDLRQQRQLLESANQRLRGERQHLRSHNQELEQTLRRQNLDHAEELHELRRTHRHERAEWRYSQGHATHEKPRTHRHTQEGNALRTSHRKRPAEKSGFSSFMRHAFCGV